MADRPILFSAPMVCALLAGTKTQTRRVLKPQPRDIDFCGPGIFHPTRVNRHGEERLGAAKFGIWAPDGFWTQRLPYAPGDRLYVREEWCSTPAYDDLKPSDMGGDEPLRYRADDATFNWAEADGALSGRRRAGMHMPRWASRITLLVTDVRVERLQGISEADARAEGIVRIGADFGAGDRPTSFDEGPNLWTVHAGHGSFNAPSPTEVYRFLWNDINGPGAWGDNPWVVAVSFDVVRGNIDQVQA